MPPHRTPPLYKITFLPVQQAAAWPSYRRRKKASEMWCTSRRSSSDDLGSGWGVARHAVIGNLKPANSWALMLPMWCLNRERSRSSSSIFPVEHLLAGFAGGRATVLWKRRHFRATLAFFSWAFLCVIWLFFF